MRRVAFLGAALRGKGFQCPCRTRLSLLGGEEARHSPLATRHFLRPAARHLPLLPLVPPPSPLDPRPSPLRRTPKSGFISRRGKDEGGNLKPEREGGGYRGSFDCALAFLRPATRHLPLDTSSTPRPPPLAPRPPSLVRIRLSPFGCRSLPSAVPPSSPDPRPSSLVLLRPPSSAPPDAVWRFAGSNPFRASGFRPRASVTRVLDSRQGAPGGAGA